MKNKILGILGVSLPFYVFGVFLSGLDEWVMGVLATTAYLGGITLVTISFHSLVKSFCK